MDSFESETQKRGEIFNETDLLKAIDRILPLSEHYEEIVNIHLDALQECECVADLACGTGILTLRYLEQGKKVTGVDISKRSLEILRKKVINSEEGKNLELLEADITHLECIPDNTFDGVSVMIASHLISDFERHIEECSRILIRGGRLVITARKADQDQKKIVEIVKRSLLKTGRFQDYEDDFSLVKDKLLMTANSRSFSLYRTDEVIGLLRGSGFGKIREIENKTEGVMYTLVAEKN